MDRVGERKRDARRLENSSGPGELEGTGGGEQCTLKFHQLEAKHFSFTNFLFFCTPKIFRSSVDTISSK